MQYIRKIILCSLLFLAMGLIGASTTLASSGTINDNGVNVRSGPGTDYSVINTLTKGTGVTILTAKGDWRQIQYGSLKGWVKSSFISAGSNTGSSTYRLRVTGDLVNLRSGPDTGYSQVGQVHKGDILTVVDTEGTWYRVKTSSGLNAYISSQFVEKDGAASPQAPVTSNSASASSAPYVQIISGPANIRTAPDSNSTKLTMLDSGTICPVLAKQSDWYKIRLSNGSTGYVASWLVKETRTAPANSPSAPAAPAVIEKPITVILDGKTLSFEVAPVIDNGNTLVPLRSIFEAMGAAVKWDNAARTVTAVRGDTNVVLTVGSTSPTVNGEVHKIAAPARIIKDRTMVPMRFVAEAFGADVKWNANNRTVTITSAEEAADEDKPEAPAVPSNTPGPDVIRLSRVKDETGVKISMQSGAELKCTIDQEDGKVTYEFPNRRIEGLYYFEEKIGSSLVKVHGRSEDDQAIVEIEFPINTVYKTASENGGKTEVFAIVNSILQVERKKFGDSGERIVITTATPVKYTHQLQGDSIVINLPNVDKGSVDDEYTYDSELIKILKISESAGQTVITIKTIDLGKYTTGTSNNGTALNIMLVGKSGIKTRNKNLVVLDPGHGGKDSGARGSNLDEKDVNLAIALKVGDILKQKGIQVEYTRTTDAYVTLEDRCKIANASDAAVFVSIHNNASTDSAIQGTETYYYAPVDNPDLFIQQDERRALAEQLQQNLKRNLGRNSRGVKQANFAVLRCTGMPSALVEIMFISNPEEQGLLLQDYTRNQAAQGIADAIAAAVK